MPSSIQTPVNEAQKKRVLADVTNQENIVAPVTCEEKMKKPKLAHQVSQSVLDNIGTEKVVVISLDGNIGAGKSTLLEAVKIALPQVEVVVEPVGKY
jgi:hypothetical protein